MSADRDRDVPGSDFAERIARLSPEARAALERRLQEKASHAPVQTIPRRGGAGPAPLSFAQERLWLLDRLDPGKPVFNISRALRIRGRLVVEALGRALGTIQERHEVLRSSFPLIDGSPVQAVAPSPETPLSHVDLIALAEADREAQALRIAEEEALRPFDLARGPLLRATLLRLGEQEHVLLVTVHHIVFDGWSSDVFDRELEVLYESYLEGRPSPLAPLAIQYADFAVWQREWLRGEVLEKQLSYWRRQLEGGLAFLELPTCRSRPPVQSFRGATETVSIPKGLAQAVRMLGQREGATLFVTLLAAFQILLQRHSGQDDVVVGSYVAGRNRSDIEGLIGFFVNTLVFRTDMAGDPTFRELLGRVREVAIGATGHQDLPFERLVEDINPERTLSHSPLFQVMMTLRNLPAAPLRLAGTAVSALRLEDQTAKFDLAAYFEDRGEEISVSFQYNTDLFDASTVRWMLGHLLTLVGGIAADPDCRLSQLPILTQGQRRALSSATNRVQPTNPFVEFPREEIEQPIAERFRQQVRRHASRIAVKTRTHCWTYARLDREANGVARALLSLTGGGPSRSALLFEQGAPMIAAILGTLKAGKAYVPLDPSYPAERLRYMLEDSGAAVVLTNERNLSLASVLADGKCPVASLDALSPGSSDGTPAPRIEPDAVAYILYTSGSTGRPKGVVQNHRNVLHFNRAYTNGLHIQSGDRLSLLASYSFDAAVMDIFGALLNGATLSPWDLKEEGVAGLPEWLAKEEITIFHAVPTVFRAFAGALAERQEFSKVRLVVLGGEEVHPRDVELYRRHFPADCLLVNGLGPTESTVALQYFLGHRTETEGHTVPVGYPVDDTEILLLDTQGRATDLSGEIGIRSPHVALGYWGKPELTQAAFLADPEDPTRRIYRTGDLGRRRPDGAIEFLGRKDTQVKVRGHRIELGEIEEALLSLPSVRRAVAMRREDVPGDPRLIAYVVGEAAQAPSSTALRAFLEGKLPDYMIPASFVWLDSFPLTPNGKLDRAALPLPVQGRPPREQEGSVRARNAVEAMLVRIYERVLDVRPVGVNDNFFDLGGHSLLAVRLLAQIEKATGKRLPLSTIFQAQTVEAMSARLEDGRAPSASSSLVTIQPGGSRPPLFCVHAWGSNSMEYRGLVPYLGPDQPLYGLAPQGLDGRLPPHDRVEDMAAHYIREIRGLQPEGPYYLGGWSLGGRVAFEMARQIQAVGQRVAFLALIDTHHSPFKGPARRGTSVGAPLRFIGARLRFHYGALRRLEPNRRRTYLFRKIRRGFVWAGRKLGGLYGSLRGSVRAPAVPEPVRVVQSANARAARAYAPKPYDGLVTLFRATDLGITSFEDPYLGWGEVPGIDIEVIQVPGIHFSILEEEATLRTLGEKLSDRLRLARETEMRPVELASPASSRRR